MGFYHDGQRALQERFSSTALADRLVENLHRTTFSDADKAFIEASSFFFLATADAEGRPDCSHKGGAPGFVQVTGPSELAFPDYDGNGMFRSLGNIAVNPSVGLLFLAMNDAPKRVRVNGRASLSFDDPSDGEVRASAGAGAGNGGAHLPELPALYPRSGAWRGFAIRSELTRRRWSRRGRALTRLKMWFRRGRLNPLPLSHLTHQIAVVTSSPRHCAGPPAKSSKSPLQRAAIILSARGLRRTSFRFFVWREQRTAPRTRR